jgi:hypothetical protein
LQQTAVFNKGYVKKSAWIGTNHLGPSFLDKVTSFSRREFPVFRSRIQALDWLTED